MRTVHYLYALNREIWHTEKKTLQLRLVIQNRKVWMIIFLALLFLTRVFIRYFFLPIIFIGHYLVQSSLTQVSSKGQAIRSCLTVAV